ncbi:methyltransferase [Chromatiales bacterium (ex Bugula neritina AB1)]|nr:methyltransferase [Chromatiales bacterium (ex Bugula neritina AB1)]
MSRPGRRRKRASTKAATVALPQLQRQVLRNRFAPVEPLDEEQINLIHEASMTLLEEQGIEVLGDMALEVLRKAGADVGDDGLVRMDRHLLMESISKAPGKFSVMPRNPDNILEVGGDVINFGLVSGPPNVHDCINGRRMGNIADFENLVRFGQFFNVITFFGNQATAPTDLPANTRHLDTLMASITLSDKPFFSIGIGAGRSLDAARMCAIARGLKLQDLVASPSAMTNININSPRKLDDSMAYGAMQLAALGQPVTVTPFTLMGAMTPATLGGALVQQNAEALFGIALLQLTRPGAPTIYGGFTSNVDMRSGAPAFGTPENSLANLAGGQLARFYKLPHRTSACNAANSVDAQATYETQMALWGSVMGHGNLIYHTAGWLEGGLVASFEKVIIDCEMLQHMTQFLQPIKIDLEEIGLEAMEQVGPGGHFFGCDHTMSRYKNAFYQPFISDWQNHESWVEAGSKDATQRATEIWPRILEEFEPPPLDPAIYEELQEYVAKRKEELGKDEPALEPEL